MRNDQLANDLHDHLSKRMRQVQIDHADTCQRAGLSAQDTAMSIMSTMLFDLTYSCMAIDMPEAHFVDMCRKSYQHMKEYPPPSMPKPKKRRARDAKPE